MYFIFLFMLLFAVYFAPALAFSPNLLRKPQTAIAIPVVSSIIVVVLASILLFLKIFNHDWVLAISIFFIIIATYTHLCPKS